MAGVRGSTSGSMPSASIPENASPETHQSISNFPAASTVPPAPRRDSAPVRRTWCRAPSLRCSQTRISSILPSTNTARRRLNFGGMGGFLVIKLVKPTKIVCSWTPNESSVGQLLLSETKPHIGTAAARVLRKADATVLQKVCRPDTANCAFHQAAKLLALFLRYRSAEVLDLDQALADDTPRTALRSWRLVLTALKDLYQHDSLPEHPIPGVSIRILQALVLARGPDLGDRRNSSHPRITD